MYNYCYYDNLQFLFYCCTNVFHCVKWYRIAHMKREDSDQTARLCSLIQVFSFCMYRLRILVNYKVIITGTDLAAGTCRPFECLWFAYAIRFFSGDAKYMFMDRSKRC